MNLATLLWNTIRGFHCLLSIVEDSSGSRRHAHDLDFETFLRHLTDRFEGASDDVSCNSCTMLSEKGRLDMPKLLAFNAVTSLYLKPFLITTYYEIQGKLIELPRLPDSYHIKRPRLPEPTG